jgi:hypothetical protein
VTEPIRNRIKGHRRVRADDLVRHEWNYRSHPESQQAALQALYQEVGFARSLLAYELPDGRLKLIDGHLRRDLDPDMEVEVEVLDVNEEEARALLLSIDPLALLAQTQTQLHERLREVTPAPAELEAAWRQAAEAVLAPRRDRWNRDPPGARQVIPEQWLVLVTCRDEKEQVALLTRLSGEGWQCKALLS